MTRLAILLLVAACAAGCHTSVYAPGATGRILDAVTYQPVVGARVTRPAIKGWRYSSTGTFRPPEGVPSSIVVANKRGDFDLPPAVHTQVAFMYLPNPYSITGSFNVTAEGYVTNELSGIATSRTSWRTELGQILLRKE
jgi:hypothetical protein